MRPMEISLVFDLRLTNVALTLTIVYATVTFMNEFRRDFRIPPLSFNSFDDT